MLESGGAALNIAVLVFREGLECILVLAAITASLVGPARAYRRPVAIGAALAFLATLGTWAVAVRAIDDLADNFSALQVQAVTGLFAVLVLLIVMNWFFHKMYWTGWITLHTSKRNDLVKKAAGGQSPAGRVMFGFGLLGFTSLYREGVEVVLFLQGYRLKLGGGPVLSGVGVGLGLTFAVAVATFWLRRRLPYRRMLVLTGVLLGLVLLVMVGEQAQEMQLAHWIPTTEVRWLEPVLSPWMGLWFSLFPTVETLSAQLLAVGMVLGSYLLARSARSRSGLVDADEPIAARVH